MQTSDESIRVLARELGERLRARGLRAATAESCTGGWVAKALTDNAGSSDWFDCGVVSYSNAAKARLLGVDPLLITTHGAVSRETVEAMAAGVLEISEAEIAVAVSGIAGPGGETPGKPVGTVWFAWAGPGSYRRSECVHLEGEREAVRRAAVVYGLRGLMAALAD